MAGKPLPRGIFWSLHSERRASHHGPSGVGRAEQTTVPGLDGCMAALPASGAAGALGEDGGGSSRRQGPSPAAITLASGSRDAVHCLPGLETKDMLVLSELLQTGTVLS